MRFFYINFILITVFMLTSCGSVKKAFNNQKKNSSDEFLVQKKSPLVMPPDYNELPNPDNDSAEVVQGSNEFKVLITNKDKNSNIKNNTENNDFEKSIIEKIQNN